MDLNDPAPVILVGAGPVGMTTALGLAHHGVRCVVVEQHPEVVRESRTLNLWAGALEVFRRWGVADALLARGEFVEELEPLDAATGRALFRLRFTGLHAVTPLPGVLMIPQDVTEEVLRERVAADPACRRVIGRCTGVEHDATGVVVTVETEHGTERLTGQYCVGADGAHSAVRAALGVTLTGQTHSQRMVLSDERLPADVSGRLRFAIRRPGFHVAIRFGARRWRLMSSIPDGVSDGDAMLPDAVTGRVESLLGVRTHITEWISTFSVHRRVADRYRVGRVLLAGDAAHLISPIGGQGMNAGMLDAENLSWKLAAVLRGDGGAALLDSYHDERHWAMTTQSARNADSATEAEMSQPPWTKLVAVRFVRAALAVPLLRDRIARSLSMLELTYPASPVLVGDHPLVGSRLDDRVLDSGDRTSDRLGVEGPSVLLVNGAELSPSGADPGGAVPVLATGRAPRGWRLRWTRGHRAVTGSARGRGRAQPDAGRGRRGAAHRHGAGRLTGACRPGRRART